MKSHKCILVVLTEVERNTFMPPYLWDQLNALSPEVHYLDPEGIEDSEDWEKHLAEINPEILVGAWKLPALPVLEPEVYALKYLCNLPGSIRRVVSKAHLENGLLVTNWGDSISRTISECALLLILSCMRRSHHWALEMHKNGGWKNPKTETQSLYERRIGIHGFGNSAQKMIPLLKPFDVKISAYSPGVPDAIFESHGVERTDTLEDLFAQNDIIVELEALTDKTRGMVTEELLRMIPEGGSFVNVGRGAVVDEDALIRVASEGNLQIALDVFVKEPLPVESPFRGMSNVILLPHISGPTTDRRQDSGRLAMANINHYLAGEIDAMQSRIEAKFYDRMT